MTETLTDAEKSQMDKEQAKRNKELWNWKPNNVQQAKIRYNWCLKQAQQRQKTLELDGVTHSREYKQYLRDEKKIYEKEAARLKDYIDDGGR